MFIYIYFNRLSDKMAAAYGFLSRRLGISLYYFTLFFFFLYFIYLLFLSLAAPAVSTCVPRMEHDCSWPAPAIGPSTSRDRRPFLPWNRAGRLLFRAPAPVTHRRVSGPTGPPTSTVSGPARGLVTPYFTGPMCRYAVTNTAVPGHPPPCK